MSVEWEKIEEVISELLRQSLFSREQGEVHERHDPDGCQFSRHYGVSDAYSEAASMLEALRSEC